MGVSGFIHVTPPVRVLFGAGTLDRLEAEADALGLSRALVLCTPEQAAQGAKVAALLGGRAAGVFTGAAMHTPVEVTDAAMAQVARLDADGLVAVGGGSAIGLGKAIAYRTDLTQIAVPTTYAGSEMTPILGQTEHGRKTTLRSPKVQPETVIYDVTLTCGLPKRMTGTSGLNAIAHAVEAMYAPDASPILLLTAEEGIRALYASLPLLADAPDDLQARARALQGAWLCATCLGQASMALHHKLCHVLGGLFDLPHAETHTVMLPHTLAYNAPAVPDAMQRIEHALGRGRPAAALFDLARSFGAPTALRDLGMPEDGVDEAVAVALRDPYGNPRLLEPDLLRRVIANAWRGVHPDLETYQAGS